MRKLIIGVILLVASVAAALWLRQHDGFIVIQLGEWSLQASLFVFVAALFVAWLVISVILGVLRRIWHAPRGVRHWLGIRRHDKARESLLNGLVEVAEGHYVAAERTLLHRADASEVPVFHHLLAAIAAQRRGSWDARDEYLKRADETEPRARVAVGLLQARLQVDAQQWEQALATLTWLRERIPSNASTLALLARTLEAVEDWERLADLLPELRRRQVFPEGELAALEARTVAARFRQVGHDDPETLEGVWQRLAREQRREAPIQAAFARALIRTGRPGEAQAKLRGWLKRQWEPELVRVWGELDGDTVSQAFAQAEKWLHQRPDDSALLLAAGRLAARGELWGRARSYLEGAAARTTDPQAQRELAELYERIGEPEKARRAYRRALGLEPSLRALPAASAAS